MRRCRLHLQSPPQISAMGIPRHGEAQLVDDYLLAEHWCFHIYSYYGTLELDRVPYPIAPGYASIIAPGTRMVYRYKGSSEHVYFHFQPSLGEPTAEFAAIFDLREQYASMDRRARQAIGLHVHDSPYPRATLWSLLCEATYLQQPHSLPDDSRHHPKVALAIRHIEQRLSHPLTVAQLCREVGVSDGYLSRIFKENLGLSVLQYVRSRRAEQAEHLIRSTTLPIKVIARSVGVPDLQQFNRLMHQMKGTSPRAIRSQEQNLSLPIETLRG